MPTRRLPQSNPARFKAFKIAKEMKDFIPPPIIIPLTPGTIVRLDTFYPLYKGKIEAGEAALNLQVGISELIKPAKQMAEYLISDFYEALQRAIRRGVIDASVRTLYGLAANNADTPEVHTEADVSYWGGKADAGETARITAGGTAIPFPTIGEVNTAVNGFKNLNMQQANAKIAYDTAQEVIAADNPEADVLILKMWNEIETEFDTGNKPSMRRKAREWGVYYLPTPGETLSPDEFSITGKVSVDGAGATPGIPDAQITVVETNTVVTSENNGNYFIPLLPPGTYTLQVIKSNFITKTIPGILVAAGSIVNVPIRLVPSGAVEGTVLQGILPLSATVIVIGTLLTAQTNPLGSYYIGDIPAGQHTIRATVNGSVPPQFIDQIVTVNAGGALSVNFVFV